MRITIWLSIAVFVTTLYWPLLLDYSGLMGCFVVVIIALCWPKWRYLIIVPLTVIYFTVFSSLSLLGVSFDNIMPASASSDSATSDRGIDVTHLSFLSERLSEQDNSITVQVKSLINTKNNGYFIANIISINNISCDLCPLVEMRWFRPTLTVQSGQVHQFKVKLKALQGKGNPAGFDRQKWRYSNHIAYVANIKEHIQVIDESISLRAQLYLKTLKMTEGMSQKGAIIALIFADKSLMSYEAKALIKQLGIAHLFAISGLHIGLMFVFAFYFFNLLIKQILPIRLLGWFSWRLVYSVSFLVCLAYGYISGFSLPTQRALLMLLITIIMLSSKRKIGLFDLLVVCFLGILLVDPLAILSSSLWLSFTAMVAIFIFSWSVRFNKLDKEEHLAWHQRAIKRFSHFFKLLVSLQLVLTLFMLPIQLINFSAISLYSLIINLIAIPVFSWVVIPITLLGAISAIVYDPLARLFFVISNFTLDTLLALFDGFTHGYIALSQFDIVMILSTLLLIFLLLFLYFVRRFFNVKSLSTYMLVSSFILFILVRVFDNTSTQKSSWQVEVFDIGQGLSVLIRSNGKALLYDTGPSYPPNYAVAEVEVLPYLQSQGIKELEYLFVSHSDNDHAGGVDSIKAVINIKEAYAGEAVKMKSNDLAFKQCRTGQEMTFDKLRVSVLSPQVVGENKNNNSCVIHITDGYRSVLLTGDIDKHLEHQLIEENSKLIESNQLKADILIAPHHGSKTSSSSAFIKQVNPRWVVFAAGYKNRWGFPKNEVVERYQKQDVIPFTTSKSGFIRFNVQNQHIEVKTYREDLAAYWYHQQIEF